MHACQNPGAVLRCMGRKADSHVWSWSFTWKQNLIITLKKTKAVCVRARNSGWDLVGPTIHSCRQLTNDIWIWMVPVLSLSVFFLSLDGSFSLVLSTALWSCFASCGCCSLHGQVLPIHVSWRLVMNKASSLLRARLFFFFSHVTRKKSQIG